MKRPKKKIIGCTYFDVKKYGMTFKEAIIKAVEDDNAFAAGDISDTLRFIHGFKYDDVYEFVRNVIPTSKLHWENLMYRSDCGE